MQLPPWTDDSPARLNQLLHLHHNGSITPQQRDEYSILLCHVIAITWKKKRYDRILPEVKLDPSDLAQDALIFLTRKTMSGAFSHLNSGDDLVFLQVLYVSLFRFVCSAVSEARRRNTEVTATDYYLAADSGGLEACSRSGDAAGAVAAIRDLDECEDYCIGGIVTRGEDETEAVSRVWLCLSERFVTTGQLLSYMEMPESVRNGKEVSGELHARVLARLNRYLREISSV